MRNVVVMGVGIHKFGRFPDKTFEELTYPAIEEALNDSGIPFKDIEVAFCGVVYSSLYDSRRVVQQFGWTGMMVHSMSQASGSSAAAFRVAYWSVAAGLYDTAPRFNERFLQKPLFFSAINRSGFTRTGVI